MSLAIEVDDITHVLLADGWHTVHDASFGIDSYEFMWREGRATTRCWRRSREAHRGSRTPRKHISGSRIQLH
jgi:hypothetical protein